VQSLAALVRKATNQHFGLTEWEHPMWSDRIKRVGTRYLTPQEKGRFMKDFTAWYDYIKKNVPTAKTVGVKDLSPAQKESSDAL
jgi:hypothetical protein